MSDLAAGSVLSCDYLLIENHAAAYAGSQSHHDNIAEAFSSALPHLSQSGHVGVVSCSD